MHGIIYGWNIDDTGYIYIVNVFEDNLSYILEKLSIKKKKKKLFRVVTIQSLAIKLVVT